MNRPVALLTALALLLIAGCPSKGSSSDGLSGHIQVTFDQELIPLAQAIVKIRPVAADENSKKVDEPGELSSNLLGIATTNSAGTFGIATLASNQTFVEYPLLRGWKYSINIEAPGYYIYEGEFTYEKGSAYMEIKLEEKMVDVVDGTGVIAIPEGGLHMGRAPMRGN